MSTIQEKFFAVMKGLGTVAQEAVQNYIDEKVFQAVSQEKERGVHNAIDALIEIGVTDKERITKFLQKYGDMRESEAKNISEQVEAVTIPTKKLADYLAKKHYSSSEIKEFMKVNMVTIKLRHEPELRKLKPEELMKKVQASKKEKK